MSRGQNVLPAPNAVLQGRFGVLLIVPSGADTGSLWRFQVFAPHGSAPPSSQIEANNIIRDLPRNGAGLMAIRQLYGSQWGGLVGLSADMMAARLKRDLADGILFAAFYIPSWDFTGFVVTKPVDISGLLADPPGTPISWTPAQRIAAMLRRIPGCMPVALRDAALGMLTPKAIALFAALAVFMAVSQAFGAGEVIDGLLVAAAWRYAGWQGLVALKDFITAIIDSAGETNLLPIQEDAQTAADALVILGLNFLNAILNRAADQEKVMSTEPDPPKEPPPVKKPPPVVKGWKDYPSTAKPATVESETQSNGVNLALKYKPGWTPAQRAEADAKVGLLNGGHTVVTKSVRAGTSAASRYKRTGNVVPTGSDVDHAIDLQMGGTDVSQICGRWIRVSIVALARKSSIRSKTYQLEP